MSRRGCRLCAPSLLQVERVISVHASRQTQAAPIGSARCCCWGGQPPVLQDQQLAEHDYWRRRANLLPRPSDSIDSIFIAMTAGRPADRQWTSRVNSVAEPREFNQGTHRELRTHDSGRMIDSQSVGQTDRQTDRQADIDVRLIKGKSTCGWRNVTAAPAQRASERERREIEPLI